MNKNSFICARPWKSIVVAGESIFNANISSSSMSESDSSKKSPRIDRENEPKSTTTTTSQSVLIIGANGSESQLDEVFIAGEKHKGERKRKSDLSSNKEKRSSAPTEKTKLYSTSTNAVVKNNLQNEAYTWSNGSIICKCCNVSIAVARKMMQHSNGKNHKKRLEAWNKENKQ